MESYNTVLSSLPVNKISPLEGSQNSLRQFRLFDIEENWEWEVAKEYRSEKLTFRVKIPI